MTTQFDRVLEEMLEEFCCEVSYLHGGIVLDVSPATEPQHLGEVGQPCPIRTRSRIIVSL
jgi:hypothetical protein